jgi:hypothetical protein
VVTATARLRGVDAATAWRRLGDRDGAAARRRRGDGVEKAW